MQYIFREVWGVTYHCNTFSGRYGASLIIAIHFQGGMGASLLKQPQKVKEVMSVFPPSPLGVFPLGVFPLGESRGVSLYLYPLLGQILSTLVCGVSRPVTCKIRILPTVHFIMFCSHVLCRSPDQALSSCHVPMSCASHLTRGCHHAHVPMSCASHLTRGCHHVMCPCHMPVT